MLLLLLWLLLGRHGGGKLARVETSRAAAQDADLLCLKPLYVLCAQTCPQSNHVCSSKNMVCWLMDQIRHAGALAGDANVLDIQTTAASYSLHAPALRLMVGRRS